MNECNSFENNSINANDKTSLTEQTKFRLSEMIGIENYSHLEINKKNHTVKN